MLNGTYYLGLTVLKLEVDQWQLRENTTVFCKRLKILIDLIEVGNGAFRPIY